MRPVRYFISLLLIGVLSFYFSCGEKKPTEEDTPQQEQAKKLQGSWSFSELVTKPTGVDAAVLNDLAMTFNIDGDNLPTTISASGAPDFFTTQSSSTWAFAGTSTTVLTFNSVEPVTGITIETLNETTLQISFNHPGLRVEGLDGEYRVILTK